MKFKTSFTQCGYHLGQFTNCRLVQLRPSIRSKEWQSPKWVCGNCREYLRGLFRYVKGNNSV